MKISQVCIANAFCRPEMKILLHFTLGVLHFAVLDYRPYSLYLLPYTLFLNCPPLAKYDYSLPCNCYRAFYL